MATQKLVRKHLIEWIEGAELTIDQGTEAGAHFFEVVQNQSRGVLARHQLQSGVSCSQTKGWYDPRAFSSKGLAAGTWVHEVTHGWGVGHTNERDDNTNELATMNPILNADTQRRFGRYTSADKKLLAREGYVITATPRNVDGDNPPPKDDNIADVTIKVGGRRYVGIAVPS